MDMPSSSGGAAKGKDKAEEPTRKPKRKIRASTIEGAVPPPTKKAALDPKMLEAVKKRNLIELNDDAPISKTGKRTSR
jgi:hypothetical protein